MEDRGKDVRDLVTQSLLGFGEGHIHVSLPGKPFTRRGVLLVINSVYDLLGVAVPAMLEGRKLLQQ